MTDLAQLKELGAKATQGEWGIDASHLIWITGPTLPVARTVVASWEHRELAIANAVWIAATCPAKLLPMLEWMQQKFGEQDDIAFRHLKRLTTLEAENKALREALEQVIAASDECTGAEPSLSALFRTIDIDARAALTPATGA